VGLKAGYTLQKISESEGIAKGTISNERKRKNTEKSEKYFSDIWYKV
jgi:hypothetical protein